jgi:hypothetical protein
MRLKDGVLDASGSCVKLTGSGEFAGDSTRATVASFTGMPPSFNVDAFRSGALVVACSDDSDVPAVVPGVYAAGTTARSIAALSEAPKSWLETAPGALAGDCVVGLVAPFVLPASGLE